MAHKPFVVIQMHEQFALMLMREALSKIRRRISNNLLLFGKLQKILLI